MVLDHSFTIQDCRGITFGPIISVAGKDAGFSSLDQDLAAVAIVFNFVNPVLALWRLIDRKQAVAR